jgi:predicted ATPase/DNA-binding response OmpR family regulator/class 3 adenylate cyclase
MKRVLIIAQEIELRARIACLMQSAGYAVELAGSRKRALEVAAGERIEVALLVNGKDLGRLELEIGRYIPRMIVLDQTDDILGPQRSLREAGTFSTQALDEQKLLDRVQRLTAAPGNVGEGARPTSVSLKIDNGRLDLAAHTFVAGCGREVGLTRAETAVLTAFVRNPCRVLSRDQLRHAVIGHEAEPHGRSIDMIVARLRHKIEQDPRRPRFILSVPGVGYKFAVKPQTVENGDPPPVVDQEKGKPLAPDVTSRHSAPEMRQLTALSCMLVDLPMAIRLDLEEVFSIVQRFQQLCTTVVTQWGGVVVTSLSGSGNILALFGYPKGHEHDAERAVYAGLDLVEKVRDLQSALGEPVKLRAAVATGLVLIGGDQAVVGDAIVIARQLRNLTPQNSVNVTASTRKLLGNMFICDDPQLCELEGVSEPVTAYRVTGKQATETRFIAKARGELTQFVGRQHELQQLSMLWERAKTGKGQVVLICGEAGIGKSRLCEAWLGRIADEPHIIIRNQCSPHHTNTPFYPIIQQLEHAARFKREDTRDVKLRKLETVLSQAGAATVADMPFFATLLSIPIDGFYPSPTVPPQRQRDLTIAALLRQVLGLALTRPVVIKIADVHWSDSSTLELLGRCIALIKTARVFVLCSFRPEFFPHWLDESHVTMLRLDRLSREQTGQIISERAGGKELPCWMQEQILSKADGVPLFAEELTNAVLESGLLQDAGDRCITTGSLSSLIPTTLLGSLTARFDRLGPSSKEVAQIGAGIGREFPYRLLAAVAPASGPLLQSAIEELTTCGLVFVRGEPPDATYIFKHALVQDATYATMPRSKRQQLHSRIADALIAEFPERVEMQPELMAYHLAQAGLTGRAIEYLRKAGQRAIERSANAEGIGHVTLALELLRSLLENPESKRAALGLEVMLSQAMIASRGYAAPETRETWLRARALTHELTEPAQKFAVLYGTWACHYVGGEVAKQRTVANEFLAEAERHNDTAALCIAHRTLGTTFITMGEFTNGLHQLERARALYDSEGHLHYRFQYGQDIGVAALCYQSWALWHLGYVDQASKVAAEAMTYAEELAHPHTVVYAICHARGFLDLFRRRPEDVQAYAERVVSLCTENGFSHWINCGRIFEGWAKIHRGEVGQGLEILRAGVLGWQKRGAQLWLPIFLTVEAEACAETGDCEAALQAIEQALAISKNTGECWEMAEVLRVKARLLQAGGRTKVQEIETLLVSALEIARSQHARSWELRVSCDLARLWQGQRRQGKALKLLQSVYGQFTEGFDTTDLRDAKALMESLRGVQVMSALGRNRRSDLDAPRQMGGNCPRNDPRNPY